jgi:hypothetical protein
MPEDFIQVNVPVTLGKKLKSWTSLDGGGNVVESEAVVPTDSLGNEILVATEPTQAQVLANLQTINSLVPTKFDYIELDYTGTDLTTVVYKLGGAAGVVVSTLTLAYSAPGGLLLSVTKT